jgi:hypothetical protein
VACAFDEQILVKTVMAVGFADGPNVVQVNLRAIAFVFDIDAREVYRSGLRGQSFSQGTNQRSSTQAMKETARRASRKRQW